MFEALTPCPEELEDECRLTRYIMTGKLTIATHIAANPIAEAPCRQILQHFEPWTNKVRASDAIISCDVVCEGSQDTSLTLIIGPGFDETDGGKMDSLLEYLGRRDPESFFETKKCGPFLLVCASGRFTETNFMERQEIFYSFLDGAR